MTDVVLVLTTVSSVDRGEAIGRALVDERLAACVNVLPPMTSIYRWQGAVTRESECQVVIKTTRDRLQQAARRVRQLHDYELPEWLVLPIDEGSVEYVAWVHGSTR